SRILVAVLAADAAARLTGGLLAGGMSTRFRLCALAVLSFARGLLALGVGCIAATRLLALIGRALLPRAFLSVGCAALLTCGGLLGTGRAGLLTHAGHDVGG